MKISTMIKITLSALALTASIPLRGEATEREQRARNPAIQNYQTMLKKIEALTARIHREVDEVLANYRRDTAEYLRRIGGRGRTATTSLFGGTSTRTTTTTTSRTQRQQRRNSAGRDQERHERRKDTPQLPKQDPGEVDGDTLIAYMHAYPGMSWDNAMETIRAIRQQETEEQSAWSVHKEAKEEKEEKRFWGNYGEIQNQGKVDEDALAVYMALYPNLPRELAIDGLRAMQKQEAINLQRFNGSGKQTTQDKRKRSSRKTADSDRTKLFCIIKENHEEEAQKIKNAEERILSLEKKIKEIKNTINPIEEQKKELEKIKNDNKENKIKYKKIKNICLKKHKEISKLELEITELKSLLNSNNFKYYRNDESIKAVVAAALQKAPDLTEKAILFFARSVNCAKGNNIGQRIGYALQTFEIMALCKKGFSIQNLEINPINNASYEESRKILSFVHQYIEETCNGNDLDMKRLDNNNFRKAIQDLKAALHMNDNDCFDNDSDITLEQGYKIIKLEKELEKDQRECSDYFHNKQKNLLNQINPENENPFIITSSISADLEEGYEDLAVTIDLFNEWNTCRTYIDSLKKQKASEGHVLCLSYDALTYNDIYATFFDRNFGVTSDAQIQEICDRIIYLANNNPKMADTAPCKLIRPRDVRDTTKYVYFSEGGFEYELDANRIAESRRYFKYQTTTNLTKICDPLKQKYHFKERVKLLFDLAPESLIPLEIAALGKDSPEWQKALEEAQLEVAAWIIPSLDDCDGGISNKLTKLELRFRNVLGNIKEPATPLTKEIASIIREIKIKRVYETGKHPQYNTDITKAYEEHQTAPDVGMQLLRLPLGLLGIYTPPVSTGHARPFYDLNQPVQIIKNLFEGNRPDRLYDIYEVTIGDNQEKITTKIGEQSVPIECPHLTVKSLIENLKTRYEGDYLTFHEYVDDFIDGDFLLLKDRDISMQGNISVFFHEYAKPNDALYFYILKRLGYVQFLSGGGDMTAESLEKILYGFDEQNDRPGTIYINGQHKTLHDLIQDEQ